jgi:acyl carrier protein
MGANLIQAESAKAATTTEDIIRDFLLQEILYDKELTGLGPDDSLLQAELLDSIAIMQLVAFCEQVFNIEIPEDELLPDNFESVRAVSRLVERLGGKAT